MPRQSDKAALQNLPVHRAHTDRHTHIHTASTCGVLQAGELEGRQAGREQADRQSGGGTVQD